MCRCFLHGTGTDRWLDKSFQLVVSANAKAAVNFEHAWGDGVAVLRFFNEVYAASGALPQDAAQIPQEAPKPLEWDLPAEVRDAIRGARASFDETIASTDLAALETDALNSADLKGYRLSPDGMMQMAFQLAHVSGGGTSHLNPMCVALTA